MLEIATDAARAIKKIRAAVGDPSTDVTNARQLYDEIRERGYRGGTTAVRKQLRAFRTDQLPKPAPPAAPRARERPA
jgi:hypothetical protein